MTLHQRQTILFLFQRCINSEVDLVTFCEDFLYHLNSFEEGSFKQVCAPLIDRATEYLANNTAPIFTPASILEASELFALIRKTYNQLTLH